MKTPQRKRLANKKWYEKNKERILKSRKENYRENPEPAKERSRKRTKEKRKECNDYNKKYRAEHPGKSTEWHRKCRYGISQEEFEQRLEKQNHLCSLCLRPFDKIPKLRPVMDHNHSTKENRDILHDECNRKLGVVENSEFLEKALQYLRKFTNGR